MKTPYLIFSNESQDLDAMDAVVYGQIGSIVNIDNPEKTPQDMILYDGLTGNVILNKEKIGNLFHEISISTTLQKSPTFDKNPQTYHVIAHPIAVKIFESMIHNDIKLRAGERTKIALTNRILGNWMGEILIQCAQSWEIMYHFPEFHKGPISYIHISP